MVLIATQEVMLGVTDFLVAQGRQALIDEMKLLAQEYFANSQKVDQLILTCSQDIWRVAVQSCWKFIASIWNTYFKYLTILAVHSSFDAWN